MRLSTASSEPHRPRTFQSRGFGRGPAPAAIVLIARVDDEARHAIDIVSDLTPTVVAVHACDPAQSEATSAFIRAWEAANLDVKLVLVAAHPGHVGTEVADYVRRNLPRRRVHAVISASRPGTPTSPTPKKLAEQPAAQLERALNDLPGLTLHWIVNERATGTPTASVPHQPLWSRTTPDWVHGNLQFHVDASAGPTTRPTRAIVVEPSTFPCKERS